MIDAACNYLNPYATATLHAATMPHTQSTPATATQHPAATTQASDYASSTASATLASLYSKTLSSCNPIATSTAAAMKLEMQYPPQASSTGSASPNSSIQSAPSSASVSPSIFPSPAQSFASMSSSPPASATSPLTSSPAAAAGGVAAVAAATGHHDLGAAAAASAAYSWNTYSAALPTRTQFPYAQYATDYYGNVGMSASAGAAWFSHQDSLYQPWSRQTYPSFNFDDIAFQTQLQRRSVRCTCPNCTNEMSGLPPIVGPDERGRKQHICHIPGCERLYGKASHLKTHLRWHTGERPFLCLTCGKRFSRSDELQRHGRTHTNYRPYACPICSKKFSRSDHLSKHKKTHFKDKKSKKAIAAEAKDQANGNTIKSEKSADSQEKMSTNQNNNTLTATNNNTNNNIVKPIAATTASAQSSSHSQASTTKTAASNRLSTQTAPQLQLKTEQPDIPAGYNPYTNLYHQSSSLFHHPHHHLSSSSAAYSGLHQSAAATQQANASLDLWHSHQQSRNAMLEQQQQHNNNTTQATTSQQLHQHQQHTQQQQHSVSNNTTAEPTPNSQHYVALAMQSESQLAAEYGLTMSAATSGGTISPLNNMQHSNATSASGSSAAAQHYSGLIGQMKSEYPGYPEFGASASYAPTTHSAFHHHPHNPWAAAAAYQHQHATA